MEDNPNLQTLAPQGFRAFWIPDFNDGPPCPKAGALPTALIPVIYFSGCFVGAAKSSAVPAPLHLDIQF